MTHDAKSIAGYAIVTGGASGLGREFCLRLACDRWHVAIVDIDRTGSEETCRLVEQAGGAGRVEECDVADPAAWLSLRDRLQADWPRLDLLVNNAGMFATAPVGQLDLADTERLIRLNLFGVVYGCNTMVPWLTESARPTADGRQPISPHIINVASSFAFLTPPGMAAYNLSKAGVVALSETLYGELRPRGVEVTIVCPGPMPTQFIEHASFDSRAFQKLTERHVRQSTLDPAHVAAAALRAAKRRQLYVVMGADQRWYWRSKRLFPTMFVKELSRRVLCDLAAIVNDKRHSTESDSLLTTND